MHLGGGVMSAVLPRPTERPHGARLQELLLPFGFALDWRVDFIWTGVEPFSGFCVAQKCQRYCLGVVSSNTACRWRHSSHRDAQTRNSMRPIGIRYV
jgi:hypothetical protein